VGRNGFDIGTDIEKSRNVPTARVETFLLLMAQMYALFIFLLCARNNLRFFFRGVGAPAQNFMQAKAHQKKWLPTHNMHITAGQSESCTANSYIKYRIKTCQQSGILHAGHLLITQNILALPPIAQWGK
jgi:hypothetical protein